MPPKSGDLPGPRPDHVSAQPTPRGETNLTPVSDEPNAAPPLTPEEQMALFEQELKETDWGHQPC